MPEQSERARRAVQYLRMSTEHQRYSLENQAAAIAIYAAEHELEVIRTYEDPGRSGLTLRERPALQRLLADALAPSRDFGTILVLDVSRWGRFQDPDQAAHYEFLCREAGVKVAYCGELFENDGSLPAMIMKHLKRIMAAEYSRELSTKVTRAKLQQARLGFRQGGSVGYGFRRQIVRADRSPRHIPSAGEEKVVRSDRVLTIPGPPEEIQVIRRIFRLFAADAGSFSGVAEQLNREGVPAGRPGRTWKPKRIANIIQNELCLGVYVYNRKKRPLRQKTTPRPPEEWVRVKVGEPIVSRALWLRAQKRAAAGGGRRRYSDAELLRLLKRLRKSAGRLSTGIIDAAPGAPYSGTYSDRFGSIERAYELIGYTAPRRQKYIPAIEGYWTRETIIAAVQRLRERHGYVSAKLLARDPLAPSPTTVGRYFGGLLACYAAAGFPVSQSQVNQQAFIRRGFTTRKRPEGLQRP